MARLVEGTPALERGACGPLDGRRERQAARLECDEGGDREQFLGLARPRRGLLPLDAATADTRLEIEEAGRFVVSGISRRNAAHRGARIAVARGAASLLRAAGRIPQLLAAFDPEEAGIRQVVRLHRAHVGADELDPGAKLSERQRALLRSSRGGDKHRQHGKDASRAQERAQHQTTVTAALSLPWTPLSSVHSNVSCPDSFAVTKKRR